MGALYVTATGTDVGKTVVACALISALKANGWPVDALKPVMSGFDPASPQVSDAGRLAVALGLAAEDIERIAPLRFKAPLAPPSAARFEGATLTAETVTKLCRERMKEAGDKLLVIEGAGGVMSPMADHITNLDLMAALKAPALLVAGSYLGAISHTLTALAALRERKLPLLGVAVSESGGDAPPSQEMTYALKVYMPGLRVFPVPRDRSYNARDMVAALIEEDWV